MAFTGHSGMQTAQSMHSSGSMVKKLGPSRKQSTGQTSTQSVYLHLIQASVTVCVILWFPILIVELKKLTFLSSDQGCPSSRFQTASRASPEAQHQTAPAPARGPLA